MDYNRHAALRFVSVIALLSLSMAPALAQSSCPPEKEGVVAKAFLPRLAARLARGEAAVIVAIGSSSTAGAGASSPAGSYTAQLEKLLAENHPGWPVRVVNAGVNGDTVKNMMLRFSRDVYAHRPDLVIWQLGANSALRDESLLTFDALFRQGLSFLRAQGTDILLMTPQFAPKIVGKPYHGDFVTDIERIAATEGISLFPRYQLMKNWILDGVLPARRMLTKDGLHLNDIGYRCIAESVEKQISSAVK
jgi:acyl-CoA thioesterase-1